MKVLPFTIPVAHDKSVIIEQVEQSYYYPYLHRHQETQITWVQEGEGTLVAGNNMHSFAAGDIFLLGANLPHLFKSNPEYFASNSNKRVKALTIFFNPYGSLSGLFDLPEMKAFKLFIQEQKHGFKVPDQNFTQISHAMHQVRNTNGPDQLIQFFNLLTSFININAALEPLSTFGGLPVISENEGLRIGNIYNFIMQNYNQPITLEDVAKEACMTSESFCRYFKKHTGHTFIYFLNEIRINEACKKLTAHKFESISSVAYKCGFNSITNFNRVFKFVIGNSPREYLDNYFSNLKSITKVAG